MSADLIAAVEDQVIEAERLTEIHRSTGDKVTLFDGPDKPADKLVDGATYEEWVAVQDEAGEARRRALSEACTSFSLVRDQLPAITATTIVERLQALGPSKLDASILADPKSTEAFEQLPATDPDDWASLIRHLAPQEEQPWVATNAPIDWATFWTRERSEEWLCEPFLARGRSHSLYAPAKQKKSLFTANVAACLAAGRAVLNQPAGAPINVVYFDMEMTEDDVQERLEAFGFGPDDDLSHFHYYVLPTLAPLDTEAGGKTVLEICDRHAAELVIIDTMSRVTSGEENKADTAKGFARCTGQPLKAAGRTVLRLDHAGKDEGQGQRGSSAKNDDVDVVWNIKLTENGVTLKATHRRIAWVPEKVDYTCTEDPVRFVPVSNSYVAGTKDIADLLDDLDVPIGVGRSKARRALSEAGHTAGNQVLSDAIRWRKEKAYEAENLSTDSFSHTPLEAVHGPERTTAA